MSEYDRIDYEWRILHPGTEGKTPNVRSNGVSWFYNDHVWLICGSGAGLGKASDVWKYSISEKLWEKTILAGDPPTFRDSLSGSYMGDGKFILFGGQGFPEPNAKLGKGAGENSRVKTFNKREVYNDLFQLDCNTFQWSHIYPNGLMFPMGRRGHSSVFISAPLGQPSLSSGSSDMENRSVSSDTSLARRASSRQSTREGIRTGTREGTRGSRASSRNSPLILDEIAPNTLVVFGGSGIELSKYTEQIYNDLWLFSIDSSVWTRLAPKSGVEPKPLFDHAMERVGDSLVVIGGISGTIKTTVHAAYDTATNTDVMLFNMRTSVWSFVKLWEPNGTPARFSLHGFSTALDVNSEHPNSIIVFGGRDIVTKTAASISRTTPVPSSTGRNVSQSRTNTYIIDLADSSITPVRCGHTLPSDRYGHMGMAAVSVDLLAQAYKPGAFTTKVQKRVNRKKNSMVQIPHKIEPMKYMFGGANMEKGGFCDPVLYALVRIRSTTDNPYVSPAPPANSLPSPVSDIGGTGLTEDSVFDDNKSMEYSVDGEESRSLTYFDEIEEDFGELNSVGGGGSSGGGDYDPRSNSIWANLQIQKVQKESTAGSNQPGGRKMDVFQPTNWSELRLALTAPLTQRFYEGSSLSMQNTNPINMDDATSSGSTISTAFSTGTRLSFATAKSSKRVALTAPAVLGDTGMSAVSVGSISRGSFNQSRTLSTSGSIGTGTGSFKSRPSTTATSGSLKSALMASGNSVMDTSTSSRPCTSLATDGESSPSQKGNKDALIKTRRLQELTAIIEPLSVDHKTKYEVRDDFRRLFA